MSSLGIAGLTGKRHQDVLRDIRKMAQAIEIPNFAQFCAKVENGVGRPTEVVNLPKRETLILVSGYSTEMRAPSEGPPRTAN
jgi:phage regulator Rha-like protein